MKEILTRQLERKLEEKEQEMQALQLSMREELQRELQYYHEQISALKNQIAAMNGTINGLTKELLDQKIELADVRALLKTTDEKTDTEESKGQMEILHGKDDAIIMIRRR